MNRGSYMKFVNPINVLEVERVDEDMLLYGVHEVKAGSLIKTDATGFKSVIEDEEKFYKENIPVREMKHSKPKRKKSPFELAAIYEGYNCLQSSIEDESYINGQMELTRNKAF
jgi:hypothetical protein